MLWLKKDLVLFYMQNKNFLKEVHYEQYSVRSRKQKETDNQFY